MQPSQRDPQLSGYTLQTRRKTAQQKIATHHMKLLVSLYIAYLAAIAYPAERPNILLILADDLGWKDTGFMGSRYFETPRLDQMAAEGMTFTQAYAAAANCAPSRACLLTGLNTPRHGIYTVENSERGDARARRIVPTTNTVHLDLRFETFAEQLQELGYQTVSIGKWHIGKSPTEHGFDTNVAGNESGLPVGGYFSPYKNPQLPNGPKGEYLTDRLTDEAIQFLTTRDHSRPFLLYLPHYAVHTPIQGKRELIDKYERKGETDGIDHPAYAAMVESLDQSVGRLLDYLDKHGLSRNTIVLFSSDNGGIADLASQHPLRAGKGSYYEGGIRVPLTFRWQGKIKPGSVADMPTTNLDIYPTLLELLGVPYKPTRFDGASIAGQLLRQEPLPERPLVWHFPIYLQSYNPKTDDGRDPLFRTRPGSALRLGPWKLHEYFEDGGLELYNLDTDIGEAQDLSTVLPAKTSELHSLLKQWRKETGAPVPAQPNQAFDAPYAERLIIKALERK